MISFFVFVRRIFLRFLKVVFIKELVEFFVVFVSVYDDACFTPTSFRLLTYSMVQRPS